MSGYLASGLAAILGLIALVHAYWAVGGLWPGRSEADLISRVFGDRRRYLPPSWIIWVVAILIGIAAVWPLLLSVTFASPLPRSAVFGIGLALALTFLARGGVGYLPARRQAHPVEPFATLDLRAYSPLCIQIGTGYAYLLFRAYIHD